MPATSNQLIVFCTTQTHYVGAFSVQTFGRFVCYNDHYVNYAVRRQMRIQRPQQIESWTPARICK